MQLSSRMLFKTAIVLLGLMLALGLFVAFSNTKQASAIDATERASIQSAIDSYIDSQYGAGGDDGEAGFLITADAVAPRLNNDGDAGTATGDYLDEGDNAANAPVFVDVLYGNGILLPATSVRVRSSNFADQSSQGDTYNYAVEVANKVQAHRDAGFSTDLVIYCLTGHAQDPVHMGYGAMSAAGYFDDPATAPVEKPLVQGLKWGRQGWNYSATVEPSYPVGGVDQTLGAAGSTTGSAPADTTTCAGKTGAELVRCAAKNATPSQLEANAPPAAYVGVDLRPSPPAGGYLGSGKSVSQPLQTLFDVSGGITNLPGTGTDQLWFYNRTQHTACMAAQGAEMLGYNAACLRWGIAAWNSGAPAEKLGDGAPWASQDPAAPDYYPYYSGVTPAGSGTDTTAPTFSAGPSVGSITDSSADITRTTSEAATSKVRYKKSSDSTWTTDNNTVLNATKTTSLSGLDASTSYDWELIAYDGNANASPMASGTFTTAAPPCSAGKPGLSIGSPSAYWGSYANYTAGILTVDWTVGNSGPDTASNVTILTSTNTDGVTAAMPVAVGTIAAGSSATATITYSNVTPAVGSWHTTMTGSADDCAGTGYTYP